MKTVIHYSTKCTMSFYTNTGERWEWGYDNIKKLGDALTLAERAYDGLLAIDPDSLETIYITDTETGEILAECTP